MLNYFCILKLHHQMPLKKKPEEVYTFIALDSCYLKMLSTIVLIALKYSLQKDDISSLGQPLDLLMHL